MKKLIAILIALVIINPTQLIAKGAKQEIKIVATGDQSGLKYACVQEKKFAHTIHCEKATYTGETTLKAAACFWCNPPKVSWSNDDSCNNIPLPGIAGNYTLKINVTDYNGLSFTKCTLTKN